jgi:hypothetical protein
MDAARKRKRATGLARWHSNRIGPALRVAQDLRRYRAETSKVREPGRGTFRALTIFFRFTKSARCERRGENGNGIFPFDVSDFLKEKSTRPEDPSLHVCLDKSDFTASFTRVRISVAHYEHPSYVVRLYTRSPSRVSIRNRNGSDFHPKQRALLRLRVSEPLAWKIVFADAKINWVSFAFSQGLITMM